MLSKNDEVTQYWAQNLICPSCKGQIKIIESSMQCKNCGSTYPIIDGIPCFMSNLLDEHQRAELESNFVSSLKKEDFKTESSNSPDSITPQWLIGKIDNNTINNDARIITIGGAWGDDLPHVKSNFKLNIDHLAHEYIKLSKPMATQQKTQGMIKHIASTSESLPFRDNYADIIFSSNSLDHVNNPLKTLIEVNRVLKPTGKFFLSVYYNSNFVDCCETTIIDDDFVSNHVKNVFDVEWMERVEAPHQVPIFFLPDKRQLEWLYLVGKKKKYVPYDAQILEQYGELTADFHKALYYDELFKYKAASPFYSKVMNSSPFLESDKMRILYSRIRYLAINDHEGFKVFFNEFKLSNFDPFWWRIVILSGSFMKDEMRKEIKQQFSGQELIFLENCIKNTAGIGVKRFVKNNKTIYRLAKPFYNLLKKTMKNKDLFERNPF